jgi:drug/metabolite transporter (DMT)-like permease
MAPVKRGRLDVRVLLALAVTLVFWAAAFAGIRAAMVSYGPGQIALLRLLVASAALAVFAAAKRMRLPDAQDLPAILACGLLGFTVYHAGLNFGERTVEAGAASLLIATAPIFVALLAHLFLGERLRRIGWIGMLVSLSGAAVISFGEGGGYGFDPNALPILLAALGESGYFAIQQPYLRKYGSLAFTTYAIWAGTLFALVFLPGLASEVPQAAPRATISVVFLGLCPTAVAYVTYAYVSSRMSASVSASFLYLIPALAFLIAWIWLGEVPTPLSVIGGLVTLCGVVIVSTRGRAAARPRSRKTGSGTSQDV